MNTYNGKIYQIICSHCNMLYIGSTKESLSKRFSRHKKASRLKKTEHFKLYQHMREVGMDKFKIVLVEELPNTNCERLRMAEHRNIILNDSVKKGLNGLYAHGTKCEHNKQRSQCKDCGGSQICEHNKRKYECKDCGGSQICEHKRVKYKCKDCNPQHRCDICGTNYAGKSALIKHYRTRKHILLAAK